MTNKRDKGAPEQGVSLDDASISKIAREIRRQDRRRHTRRNLVDVLFKDILTVRDDLQLHHKIFYVFLVFSEWSSCSAACGKSLPYFRF